MYVEALRAGRSSMRSRASSSTSLRPHDDGFVTSIVSLQLGMLNDTVSQASGLFPRMSGWPQAEFGIHAMVPELRQLTNVGLALGAQNSSSDGDVDSDVAAEDAAPLDSAAAPMAALADGVVNDGAVEPSLGVGLAEQLGESEEVGLVQTHVAGVPSSSSGGGGVPGPLVEGPASAASVLPPGPSSSMTWTTHCIAGMGD